MPMLILKTPAYFCCTLVMLKLRPDILKQVEFFQIGTSSLNLKNTHVNVSNVIRLPMCSMHACMFLTYHPNTTAGGRAFTLGSNTTFFLPSLTVTVLRCSFLYVMLRNGCSRMKNFKQIKFSHRCIKMIIMLHSATATSGCSPITETFAVALWWIWGKVL